MTFSPFLPLLAACGPTSTFNPKDYVLGDRPSVDDVDFDSSEELRTVFPEQQLVVTEADVSPDQKIVLAGYSDELVKVLRFEAVGGEPLDMVIFPLPLQGVAGVADGITACFYDTRGNPACREGMITGNRVHFEDAHMFVPTDPSVEALMAVYIDVTRDGADPGDAFGAGWSDDSDFRAVGIRSRTVYGGEIAAGGRVDATLHVFHDTKISVEALDDTPSGNIGIGDDLLYVVGFRARSDPNGDALIDGVEYVVNSTDGGGTGWNLCSNMGDASQWSVYDINHEAPLIMESEFDFYGASGPCSDFPGEPLDRIVAHFRRALSAGTEAGFKLYRTPPSCGRVDPSSGDELRVDVTDVTWFDAAWPVSFGGYLVEGVPFIADAPLVFSGY